MTTALIFGGIFSGDASYYPNGFPLADDSAAPTAGAFNPAIEALGNRTAYLKELADANKCVPVYVEFIESSTITIPTTAAPFAFYEGCGGGGAGGQGATATTNAQGTLLPGGGGGGGAIGRSGICKVYPGEVHDVHCGAGGVGTDGFYGIGFPGEDTVFKRDSTNENLAVAAARTAAILARSAFRPDATQATPSTADRRKRLATSPHSRPFTDSRAVEAR